MTDTDSLTLTYRLNPCQSLILYLLEQLHVKEYRRCMVGDNVMCCEKIYNKKGQNTYTWKISMTIKDFIFDNTRKELNINMWKNLTASKDNLMFVTQYLTECPSSEFEDLKKDRHVFSFNNGIYITKVKNVDRWIPFDGPEAKNIGASVVASKYFDLEFEDCSQKNGYEDWFDIIKQKCPNFKSVVDKQSWSEDVKRLLCILMGRMLYDIGELDDWQVCFFLLGVPGSGRSMIIDTLKQFYEPEDIGTIKKKFCLKSLIEKKIVIYPEIEDKIVDLEELQFMISGESIQINSMFKQTTSLKFNPHIIIAGNIAPDNISRNTTVFPFEYEYDDTKFGQNIQKEMAYIIQACNKGYIEAVHKYGSYYK